MAKAVSKVIRDGNILIDLTNDTVVPEAMMQGTIAHAANGNIIIGNSNNMIIDDLEAYKASLTVTIDGIVQDIQYNKGYIFAYNKNFNIPVIIHNNTNCSYMFSHCQNFNQPIIIPNNTNCSGMFHDCYAFNQPIIIPNNIIGCSYMFYNCFNFNQSVTISNGVTGSCYSMFYNCQNFNQPITIPNSITDCRNMFNNCFNMFSNIYFNHINTDPSISLTDFIRGKNNNKRINIFCNDISKLTNSSIVGITPTWYAMVNGYFNEFYNIYLYNNYFI